MSYRPGRATPVLLRLPLRQALRAATAAPTLFTPLKIRSQVFCDGAIQANNPAAVALHEAARLFPGQKVDAVVSVGTGERTPSLDERIVDGDISWDNIVSQFIDSATSTTLIHDALLDLAPSDTLPVFSARRQRRHRRDRFRYSRRVPTGGAGLFRRRGGETRARACAAALGLFRGCSLSRGGAGVSRSRRTRGDLTFVFAASVLG